MSPLLSFNMHCGRGAVGNDTTYVWMQRMSLKLRPRFPHLRPFLVSYGAFYLSTRLDLRVGFPSYEPEVANRTPPRSYITRLNSEDPEFSNKDGYSELARDAPCCYDNNADS